MDDTRPMSVVNPSSGRGVALVDRRIAAVTAACALSSAMVGSMIHGSPQLGNFGLTMRTHPTGLLLVDFAPHKDVSLRLAKEGLVKKLRKIRERALNNGVTTLSMESIRAEVKDRRGE